MTSNFRILLPAGWRFLKAEETIAAGDRIYYDLLERFGKPISQFHHATGRTVSETDMVVIRRIEL